MKKLNFLRFKVFNGFLFKAGFSFFVLTYFCLFFKSGHLTFAKGSEKSEDLGLAIHLFKDGLYEMALEGFRSIIKKDPNAPEAVDALYYAAESLFAMGKWDAAVENYRIFLKKAQKEEQKGSSMHNFAQALVRTGDLVGAIELYKQWLVLNKNKQKEKEIVSSLMAVEQELAFSLLKDGKYKNAMDIFNELLKEEDNEVNRAILEKGVADSLFFLKQWSEAIKAYDTICKKYPKEPIVEQIKIQIMLARFSLKAWKALLEETEKFLNEYPKSPLMLRVLYLKAWTLYSSGEPKSAVEFLFSQPEIVPVLDWQKDFRLIKADEAWMRKDYSESITYLKKIIEQAEKDLDKIRTPHNKTIEKGKENTSLPALKKEDKGEVQEDTLKNLWITNGISVPMQTKVGTKASENIAEFSDERSLWFAKIKLASALWRMWKFKQASTIYREVWESGPSDDIKILAKIEEAQSYFDNGWYAKVNEITKSLPDLGLNDLYGDRILFLSAESFFRSRMSTEARELFNLLRIKYPNSEYLEEVEWKLAQGYYEQCNFQEAIKSLELFIHNYPDSALIPEAFYLIGSSYIYLEEFNYAEKTFQELLKSYPEGNLAAMAFFSIGKIYFQKGDYEKAIDAFSETVAKSDDSSQIQKAKFMIALGNLHRQKYDLAIDGFSMILKDDDPKHQDDALMLSGFAWLEKGKHKKANDIFEEYFGKYGSSNAFVFSIPLLWQLARNSYLLGNYQQAMDWIDLILCEPDETPYHGLADLLNAQCLLEKKDYIGFLEHWGPFLDYNPGVDFDTDQDFEKALNFFKNGEFRQAEKAYKALAVKYAGIPEEVGALLGLGTAQAELGALKSAIRTYNHLMRRCNSDDCSMKVHQALGEVLYKAKLYKSATRHLEKVVSSNAPDELKGKGIYCLGLNYLSQGRKSSALKEFRKLLLNYKLDPISTKEKMDLALFLEEEGEYGLAINVFLKVIETDTVDKTTRAEAQFWIGECHQKMGNREKAILEYLKVTYLYPDASMWGITARFKSAEIYQDMGDLEKALNLYRKVEEDSRGTKYGQFAGKRVKEIEDLMKKKEKEI